MTVLADGLSVLSGNWQIILGILLIVFSCQVFVASASRAIFGNRLTAQEYFSLGLAGWALPVLFFSIPWFLADLGRLAQPPFLLAFIVLGFPVSVILFTMDWQGVQASRMVLSAISVFLLLSILLRLAFVAKAIIPLYFDSAEHYSIIKGLLAHLESAEPFRWPSTPYYHIGFHFLTAFAISATGAEISNGILILGQIILAATPLSIFLLIRHETGSNNAGIFAILLAAFGWYMPAYALNWGKYPALASLAPLQFVLSTAYLYSRYKSELSLQKQWLLRALLAAGMIFTVLIHSRSLVIFAIAFTAWAAASKWRDLSLRFRILILALVLAGIVAEFLYIQPQEILERLFDPYINQGYVVTILILLLSVFALKAYPQPAFASFLAILLLLGSLFIPVTKVLPAYGNLTLLDRPFVELILYLPLSLLGGLGLAGLEQILRGLQMKPGTFRVSWDKYVGLLAILFILGNTFMKYTVYPSDCCNIVNRDDLLAIDWMDKNLPSDARILISSTELRVLPSGLSQGASGSDAGIWINPLIHRNTILMPSNLDFSLRNTLNIICRRRISHIYVGGVGITFDDSKLTTHPNWYENLLSTPSTKVYQVAGCP